MSHEGAASVQLSDTTPRALQRYLERLRATPPRQRLERALRLSEQVREATMTDVRRQHPDASQAELALAFVRRVYGDELAARFAAHRTRP
jgi:hypothetical protein